MTLLRSESSSMKDFYVKAHQLYYISTVSSGMKDLAWLTLHRSASVKDWTSTLLRSIVFLCQAQWKANKSNIFHFTWGLTSMHWGWQSLRPVYIYLCKKNKKKEKKRERCEILTNKGLRILQNCDWSLDNLLNVLAINNARVIRTNPSPYMDKQSIHNIKWLSLPQILTRLELWV